MSVVPCKYAGRTYPSLTAAAHAFGLGLETCRQRLRKGMPLEAAYNFRRLVTYDGRTWSLRELAEHCGVSPRTIARRLRKGGDPAFSGRCGKACEYQGKRYASVTAMACELEINWKNAFVLVESEGRWL